jgi:hypothetical protein
MRGQGGKAGSRQKSLATRCGSGAPLPPACASVAWRPGLRPAPPWRRRLQGSGRQGGKQWIKWLGKHIRALSKPSLSSSTSQRLAL